MQSDDYALVIHFSCFIVGQTKKNQLQNINVRFLHNSLIRSQFFSNKRRYMTNANVGKE